MKYSELFESSGGWISGYYHGDSERMEEGISNRQFLFLTTDKKEARQYGRYVYRCELLMNNIADLTDRRSKPFRDAVAKFVDDNPSVERFLLGHKMFATNKFLETEIFKYLFGIGYEVIEFRDESWDEEEIFNIVALGKNVNITERME